jgi:TPR repeat protein
MLKRFFVLFILLTLCVGAAWGNEYEDGVAAFKSEDYETAFKKFKIATAQGNVDAQVFIGAFYVQGLVVKQDYHRAMGLFKLAANRGHTEAQFNIGQMYIQGMGVVQDYAEAVRWYKLAAAQGYTTAQFNLGVLYDEGLGVGQDYVRAHMWFNLAAPKDPKAAAKRTELAKAMTPQQIVQAEKLARECKRRDFKNCD